MNFLIYDKRATVIHGLNIEPVVTKFQVEDALKDFMKSKRLTSSVDFSIVSFQQYLFDKLEVRSVEFKFNRLNLEV